MQLVHKINLKNRLCGNIKKSSRKERKTEGEKGRERENKKEIT